MRDTIDPRSPREIVWAEIRAGILGEVERDVCGCVTYRVKLTGQSEIVGDSDYLTFHVHPCITAGAHE